MTSRERMLRALRHRESDRVPICDSPWVTTVERWHREGLPADTTPHAFFGYERAGAGADLSFRMPLETLEETDGWKTVKDAWGATTKVLKGSESVPEPIDFSIKQRRDWDALKPRYVWTDDRVNWEPAVAGNLSLAETGQFIQFSAGFGFDRVQRFVGMPRLLMAMLDEPDWVREMMRATAELIVAAVEEMVHRGLHLDAAFIWNDLAYRNGPFFSPAAFREFELPNQKRLCDCFHAHGLPVILHSDGDIRPLIPMLIEAGFDCLQPLEVKAGMNVVELKHEYGDRLAFMGGIDTRTMADPDPAVIEREIRTKIPVAMKGGGYIYHSDHSVPDNVSFAQYQRVIELVLQYGTF